MNSAVIFFIVLTIGLKQCESFEAPHGIPPADPPDARARAPVWGTIVQKLDHFNSSDTRTWNMRYITNNQWYKPGGPIFLMCGGEWTINGGYLQSGYMYNMAQEHKAYMIYTEHRYYGESKPTSNLSPENLKYLTTELALEDIAVFLKSKKAEIPDLANAKVVAFGGSYGATMSLWMRVRYPNLIHAAVSSSAPVLAKAQFDEYFTVIQEALGPNCASVVSKAVDEIKEKLKTTAGQAQVKKDFNPCVMVTPNNELEYWNFFSKLAGSISGKMQYADNNTVSKICSVLEDTSIGSEYQRFAQYTASGIYCKGSYNQSNSGALPIDSWTGGRQYSYMTCNQLGWFQTSSYSSNMYRDTINVKLGLQRCRDRFGPEMTPQRTEEGIALTNKHFGGYSPNVTRVISIHGSLDPWRGLGLSKDVNADAPTIIVKGGSHCGDMFTLKDTDSDAMRAAKLLTFDRVRYWLSLD